MKVLTNNMIRCKIFFRLQLQQTLLHIKNLSSTSAERFKTQYNVLRDFFRLRLNKRFSMQHLKALNIYMIPAILLWTSTQFWKITHITCKHSTIMYFLLWTIPFSSATRKVGELENGSNGHGTNMYFAMVFMTESSFLLFARGKVHESYLEIFFNIWRFLKIIW